MNDTASRRYLSAREVLEAASKPGAKVTRARLLYAASKGAVMPPEKVCRHREGPKLCWWSEDLADIVDYFERHPRRLNARCEDPPRYLPGQITFGFFQAERTGLDESNRSRNTATCFDCSGTRTTLSEAKDGERIEHRHGDQATS